MGDWKKEWEKSKKDVEKLKQRIGITAPQVPDSVRNEVLRPQLKATESNPITKSVEDRIQEIDDKTFNLFMGATSSIDKGKVASPNSPNFKSDFEKSIEKQRTEIDYYNLLNRKEDSPVEKNYSADKKKTTSPNGILKSSYEAYIENQRNIAQPRRMSDKEFYNLSDEEFEEGFKKNVFRLATDKDVENMSDADIREAREKGLSPMTKLDRIPQLGFTSEEKEQFFSQLTEEEKQYLEENKRDRKDDFWAIQQNDNHDIELILAKRYWDAKAAQETFLKEEIPKKEKELEQKSLDESAEISKLIKEGKDKRSMAAQILSGAGGSIQHGVYLPNNAYANMAGINVGGDYYLAHHIVSGAKKTIEAPLTGSSPSAFLKGAKDAVTDLQFWTLGLSNLAYYPRIKEITEKAGKGVKLSESEEAILDALLLRGQAEMIRSGNTSNWYSGGKIGAESIPFMLEFYATAGVGAATRKGVEKTIIYGLRKHIENKLKRRLGKEGLERALRTPQMQKILAKSELGVMNAFEKPLVRGVTDFVAGSPVRAPLMGSFYGGIGRNLTPQVEDKTPDGRYAIKDGMSITDAVLSSFGEVNSEMFGGLINPAFGKAMKIFGISRIPNSTVRGSLNGISKIMANSNKALNNIGYHGLFTEMLEEDFKNMQDYILGISTGEEWAEFYTLDNRLSMMIGFAPMTAFGAVGNFTQRRAINKNFAANSAALDDILKQAGLTTEEIQKIKSDIDNTPITDLGLGIDNLIRHLGGYTDDKINKERGDALLGAFSNYVFSKAQIEALNGIDSDADASLPGIPNTITKNVEDGKISVDITDAQGNILHTREFKNEATADLYKDQLTDKYLNPQGEFRKKIDEQIKEYRKRYAEYVDFLTYDKPVNGNNVVIISTVKDLPEDSKIKNGSEVVILSEQGDNCVVAFMGKDGILERGLLNRSHIAGNPLVVEANQVYESQLQFHSQILGRTSVGTFETTLNNAAKEGNVQYDNYSKSKVGDEIIYNGKKGVITGQINDQTGVAIANVQLEDGTVIEDVDLSKVENPKRITFNVANQQIEFTADTETGAYSSQPVSIEEANAINDNLSLAAGYTSKVVEETDPNNPAQKSARVVISQNSPENIAGTEAAQQQPQEQPVQESSIEQRKIKAEESYRNEFNALMEVYNNPEAPLEERQNALASLKEITDVYNEELRKLEEEERNPPQQPQPQSEQTQPQPQSEQTQPEAQPETEEQAQKRQFYESLPRTKKGELNHKAMTVPQKLQYAEYEKGVEFAIKAAQISKAALNNEIEKLNAKLEKEPDIAKITDIQKKIDALQEGIAVADEYINNRTAQAQAQANTPETMQTNESQSQNQTIEDLVKNREEIEYDSKVWNNAENKMEKTSGVSNIISLADRKIVVINVNGMRIPFYLSTGHGGKANVTSGKWYPFFGISEDGWLNKLSEKEINDYYGSDILRQISEELDRQIGDVRNDASIPKVGLRGRQTDAINADIKPTENGHANTRKDIAENIEKVKNHLDKTFGQSTKSEQAEQTQQTDAQTAPVSEQEALQLIELMEQNAEEAPVLELTPENWYAEFGEDGMVETPVGKVKMGENQYIKIQAKKRQDEFGMVKPTLTNPDIIIEKYAPEDNAERETKLLFIKTFTDNKGEKYIHFESVTVQKDGMEVSISSHIADKKAIANEIINETIAYNKFASNSSERYLAEDQNSLPDIVPTQEAIDRKDTKKSNTNSENAEEKNQPKEEKPLSFSQRLKKINDLLDEIGGFLNPKAKILYGIAVGEYKFKWKGKGGLADELGISKGNRKYWINIINDKNGYTPTSLAETIADELNMEDTNELRNIIVDNLTSGSSRARALEELESMYGEFIRQGEGNLTPEEISLLEGQTTEYTPSEDLPQPEEREKKKRRPKENRTWIDDMVVDFLGIEEEESFEQGEYEIENPEDAHVPFQIESTQFTPISEAEFNELIGLLQARGLAKEVVTDETRMRQYLAEHFGDEAAERFMTAWHGSGTNIDKFSFDYIAKTGGRNKYGMGIYFGVNKQTGIGYTPDGGYLHEVEISDNANLPNWSDQMSEQDLGKLMEVLPEDAKQSISELENKSYSNVYSALTEYFRPAQTEESKQLRGMDLFNAGLNSRTEGLEKASKAFKDSGVDGFLVNKGAFVTVINDDVIEIKSKEQLRFMSTPLGEVYGFATPEGVVYIDPTKMNANTPIHEFGHLWNTFIKENHKELWEKGVVLAKESKLWNKIAGNPKAFGLPKNATEDQIADEVLTRMYGNRGETVTQEKGLRERLLEWINEVWQWIGSKAGILNLTSEQIQNLTLNQFVDGAVADLLSGESISKIANQDNYDFDVSGIMESNASEMQQIKTEAQQNGTFMQAPNGEPTRLDERQWLQVRTKAFKQWFGDWENDPENSSKAIDENGEPIPVAHSTNAEFTVFKNQQENDSGWLGAGYYFFGDRSLDGQYGENVMEAFLNIRNPYYASDEDIQRLSELNDNAESVDFTEELKESGYDGVYYNGNLNQEFVAFNPAQIKSATSNNGNFDEESDDIRYQFIGEQGAAALDASNEATSRIENLRTAREMETDGKDAKTIKLATGWERGADGKWRYEIPDVDVNVDKLDYKKQGYKDPYDFYGKKQNLSDVVHAPELFEAYPELKDVNVELVKSDKLGYGVYANWNNKTKTLSISSILFNEEEMQGSANRYFAHEIQHAIQDIEGFAQGTTVKRGNTKKYTNTAGEVESRNVENRINMTAEERRATLAAETEDVAREDQIFIFDALENNLKNSEKNSTFAERIINEKRIKEWLSDENLEWAKGKTREEIFEKFGNDLESIAFIDPAYLGYLGENIEDNHVYSGKGYFIDHAVNHHPEVIPEEYNNIQDILDNPDEVLLDDSKSKNALVFVKQYESLGTVIVNVDKANNGMLVFHKSFFNQRKNSYAKYQSVRVIPSLVGGHSTISPADNTTSASAPSALNDAAKIQNFSTQIDNLNEESEESEETIRFQVADNSEIEPTPVMQDGESMDEFIKRASEWYEKNRDKIVLAKDSLEIERRKMRNLRASYKRLKNRYEKLKENKEMREEFVDEVIEYIKKGLSPNMLGSTGKQMLNDLLNAVKSASKANDITTVFRDIEHTLNHIENKRLSNLLGMLLKTKVSGKNKNGISVAKQVDWETKAVMEHLREYMKLKKEQIEEETEKVSEEIANGKNVSENALKLKALGFVDIVDIINNQKGTIESIEKDIREAKKQKAKARGENDKAQVELMETVEKELHDELFDEQSSLREMYENAIINFRDFIAEGKSKLSEFRERKVERKSRIAKMSFEALGNKKIEQDRVDSKKGWFKKFWDGITSPLHSFEFVLKYMDRTHPSGEGALYDYFMRSENGLSSAVRNYENGYREFKERVAEKAKEVFGKKINDVFKDSKKDSGLKLSRENIFTGELYEKNMSYGELLYIYMVSRQTDGKAKLARDGITDATIERIKEALGEKYVSFGEWVSDEFLPSLWTKYNETHKRVYGTEMRKRGHYFPLRYSKSSAKEEVDIGNENKYKLPSHISGSLINRVRNNRPISFTDNAFSVLLEHGDEMERWNAFIEVDEDINGMLSNRRFREQLEANEKGLFKIFFEAAKVATGTYQTQETDLEAFLNPAHGLIAGGKIAFRVNTALKQILSLPAFAKYSVNPKYIAKLAYHLSPHRWVANYKWAYENLPGFKERIQVGNIGDEKLLENRDKLDQTASFIDRVLKAGIIPNRMMDAKPRR